MRHYIFLVFFILNCPFFISKVNAQDVENEESEEAWEDINYPVKFSGAQPNIVDFVHAFLDIEGVCEGFQAIREAMEEYDKGKKVSRGVLTVDKKNGYLSHTVDWGAEDEDDPTPHVSTVEACYWNCKDGKHKLIAVNLNSKYGDSYVCTEVTGLSLLLYNNQTRTMVWKYLRDFGADFEVGELFWPVLSEDEVNNNHTDEVFKYYPVYFLPQAGKDIKVDIMDYKIPESQHRACTLVWNGQKFDKKFNK